MGVVVADEIPLEAGIWTFSTAIDAAAVRFNNRWSFVSFNRD